MIYLSSNLLWKYVTDSKSLINQYYTLVHTQFRISVSECTTQSVISRHHTLPATKLDRMNVLYMFEHISINMVRQVKYNVQNVSDYLDNDIDI